MPPIASRIVDAPDDALVKAWIAKMPATHVPMDGGVKDASEDAHHDAADAHEDAHEDAADAHEDVPDAHEDATDAGHAGDAGHEGDATLDAAKD